MEPETEPSLRIGVVNGARAVFQKGLVDFGEGNISLRVPGREELFITPTFNRYDAMAEQDVVHLRFDGAQISRGHPASTEYRLHVAVYRARPRAGCVIHTHSPYATMLSVVRRRIPVLMEEMVILLGGAVEVSEFGIAHTEGIGEKAVDALGSTNATLLASHGVLVCGRTMEDAVKIAELVEKMALIYWGAGQIGEPTVIPEEAYRNLIGDFDSGFSTR